MYIKNNKAYFSDGGHIYFEGLKFENFKPTASNELIYRYSVQMNYSNEYEIVIDFAYNNFNTDYQFVLCPINKVNLLMTINKIADEILKVLNFIKKYNINIYIDLISFENYKNIKNYHIRPVNYITIFDSVESADLYACFVDNTDDIILVHQIKYYHDDVDYDNLHSSHASIYIYDNMLLCTNVNTNGILDYTLEHKIYYPNKFDQSIDINIDNQDINFAESLYATKYGNRCITKYDNSIGIYYMTDQSVIYEFFKNFNTFANISEFYINDKLDLLRYL